MKVVTYRIKLLEPVLVTSLEGDPNSATTFDYLPGSVLRGAIIGRYLASQHLDQTQFSAGDAMMQRLFFNGLTRYLNGYPVDSNHRALPVPQSWQREKGKEKEIFDFAVEPVEDGRQWQSIGKPFCFTHDEEGDPQAGFVQPAHLITVHTARDRIYGRARTGSGAVYRYESLQGGQTFEAAIVCDHDIDVATLLPLLSGKATLGGSRSGGYGRVKFLQAQEHNDWREIGRALQPAYDNNLIITLLSDALIRDSMGQFVVDPFVVTTALSAALGSIPLSLIKGRTFIKGAPVGGFNRKWGLPLPQALAVRMGSVFVYDASNVNVDAVRMLEARGIGDRKAEGFGRVAVNWQTEEQLTKVPAASERTPARDITEVNSVAIAQAMARRMLRQRLDLAVTERANSLGRIIKGPSNSQLSRLRLIIHDALRQEPSEGRQRLNGYFDNLVSRQTTRKQFTRDRVSTQTMLQWMRERTADEDGIDSIEIARTTVGANVSAGLTSELIYEYNLRLIDGVLARVAKERKREN